MHRHRLTRSAALGLALAALVGTTGYAQAQDLRSPDSREAGPTGQAPPLPAYPTPALGAQDLRTPDSRDAGEGRGTFSAPEVVFVRVPQRSSAAGAVDGVTPGSEPAPWLSSRSRSAPASSCSAPPAPRHGAPPRGHDRLKATRHPARGALEAELAVARLDLREQRRRPLPVSVLAAPEQHAGVVACRARASHGRAPMRGVHPRSRPRRCPAASSQRPRSCAARTPERTAPTEPSATSPARPPRSPAP